MEDDSSGQSSGQKQGYVATEPVKKKYDPLSYDDKPDWQKPGYVGPMPTPEPEPGKEAYDNKPADQKPCSDPNSTCHKESVKTGSSAD